MSSEDATKNEAMLRLFAEKFDPPLNVVGTQNVGGSPVRDGFMCAFHDPNIEAGITAIAFGKQKFKAWLEVLGDGSAEQSGELFAEILKRLK